jgi:hypothetical protein
MNEMAQSGGTSPVQDAATGASRKQMTLFSRAGAPELSHDIMPYEGVDDGVIAGFMKIAAAGGAEVMGAVTGLLFREPGATGLSLCHAWFKSDYIVPRHSHNADCIYYILDGEVIMGTRTLRKGEGVFVPADFGYTLQAGPRGAEVLEFRNATEFHIHFKNNDGAYWDKIAAVQQEKAAVWPSEMPPSAQ